MAATRAVQTAFQISARLSVPARFQQSKTRTVTKSLRKSNDWYIKRHRGSPETFKAATICTMSNTKPTKQTAASAGRSSNAEVLEVCEVVETCETPHVSTLPQEEPVVLNVIPVDEVPDIAPPREETPKEKPLPDEDTPGEDSDDSSIMMAQGLLFINLASMLFGTSSVMIKSSNAADLPAEYILPLRFTLAAVCFAPQIIKAFKNEKMREAGLVSGFWLFVGYALQAYGLETTSAARGSFCLAFTVLAVPLILGAGGRKIEKAQWIASVVALGGVGLLTTSGGDIQIGDGLCLVSAALFGYHKILVEKYSRQFDNGVAFTGVSIVLFLTAMHKSKTLQVM